MMENISQFSPIIHPTKAVELLHNEHVIFVDCSPYTFYCKSHLKDAIHLDLDTHLAKIPIDPSRGGRHPLPSIQDFVSTLSRKGITPHHHIILYDHKSGANYAARCWWMLRAIGHRDVQVVDGGFQGLMAENFPLSSGEEKVRTPTEYVYKAENWQLPIIRLEEVDEVVHHASDIILDVRDCARYLGTSEPIDLVAGHIPGALNIPFSENLNQNGYFLSATVLRDKYKHLSDSSVIHCGSGVTACHTILAMAYAGLSLPKLYVGSWSEWSRNNRIIKTGDT
jgi:thiosulfate/3-mercaptopyruvate sulfurtransferase